MVAVGFPSVAHGAVATHLYIQGVCPPPTPGFCTLRTVSSGVPFTLAAAALDANGNPDAGYTGTWAFTSSDPLGTLPPARIVVPADQGHVILIDPAILRTVGLQTITVTEAAGVLPPATVTLVVWPSPAGASIPAMSTVGAVALALALAGIGARLAAALK
jgi:hypothetical protein